MSPSIDEQIYKIAKGSLRSSGGVAYAEFKRGLRPRYFVVWRDILLGHLALAGIVAALIWLQRSWPWSWFLTVPIAACLLGFTFAYLNLFFHEAAHSNLAPSERWNDRLADWLIGIFFGQSIAAYRIVHFGHHQHHGTPMDTEHSYFDPLNMRFIAAALLGIWAFQVVQNRDTVVYASATAPAARHAARFALLRGLVFNGAIVCGAFFAGYWTVSVAWALGVLSVFPFLNAVRQIIEHRAEDASAAVDYGTVPHGRVNRLFGDGPLAQTFGGAGFNRHLLHHWEMQVSYTRLRELEAFVMDCECAPLFRQRQTTYARTFWHFLRRGSR